MQVRTNGVVVFVPKYGIEGPVYLTQKAKDGTTGGPGAASKSKHNLEAEYMLDEEKQTIVSKDGSLRYKVFDKAAVRISVVEGMGRRRQLLLQLVDRSVLPKSEQAQA
jgi:exosome complex exonuclease DIS3/RRP44